VEPAQGFKQFHWLKTGVGEDGHKHLLVNNLKGVSSRLVQKKNFLSIQKNSGVMRLVAQILRG
jgi:hypothetical protein